MASDLTFCQRKSGWLQFHTESQITDNRVTPRAWAQMLAADRPGVIEVVTDPEVAPLPPHVTLAQVVHDIDGEGRPRCAPDHH